MSYCRWSSMDFHCDIYAYESVGDFWAIHVAGNRVLGDIPEITARLDRDSTEETQKAWVEAYGAQSAAQHAFLETAKRQAISLPHAGETFNCATLQEFRDKLMDLRKIGYIFPDDVIDAIDEEIAETTA